MTLELQVPAWTGGLAWAAEIRRQAMIMRCRSAHHNRLEGTCRLLTAWRVRSPVQCNAAAIAAIAAILEGVKASGGVNIGPLGPHRTGWTRAELGELLVETRNRQRLLELGRDRARTRGPRFDPRLIPDRSLETLIQRHPDLAVVDTLRDERRRRQAP